MNNPIPRIIVALDYSDRESALNFIDQVNPQLCSLKVGKRLFTQLGPDFVRELVAKKFSVFLDLKYHDIPNTVFEACTAAAELGVWMLNVHVSGGVKMMRAARAAIDAFPVANRPLLIGVTILTSLDNDDLAFLGIHDSTDDIVLRMAQAAKESGLDGVVCSAKEAAFLRKNMGNNFLLVTPGIRLAMDELADQKRVLTPVAALQAGADYLVMGRSITQASNPKEVVEALNETLFSGHK